MTSMKVNPAIENTDVTITNLKTPSSLATTRDHRAPPPAPGTRSSLMMRDP
jgi:hypothetical protein